VYTYLLHGATDLFVNLQLTTHALPIYTSQTHSRLAIDSKSSYKVPVCVTLSRSISPTVRILPSASDVCRWCLLFIALLTSSAAVESISEMCYWVIGTRVCAESRAYPRWSFDLLRALPWKQRQLQLLLYEWEHILVLKHHVLWTGPMQFGEYNVIG
jgi:hypothetical protein